MRYLLDTHIWLWMLREPHKLSSLVHQTLYEPSNERYLSPISIWEVTVLLEKKRIAMHEDFGVWFARTSEDVQLIEAALNWEIPPPAEERSGSCRWPQQSPKPAACRCR